MTLLPHKKIELKFLQPHRAKSISKSDRRFVNVYDVYRVIGYYVVSHLAGRPRMKMMCRIAGKRGEWYKIAGTKRDPKDKRKGLLWEVVAGPCKTRKEAALARPRLGRVSKNRKPRKPVRKHYGVRRGYGDDLYSWEVYHKPSGRTLVDGESKRQAEWIADQEEKKALAKEKAPCGCVLPKKHRDCAYCGMTSHSDGKVCGVCSENGIDGKVIRGTARRKCDGHQEMESMLSELRDPNLHAEDRESIQHELHILRRKLEGVTDGS